MLQTSYTQFDSSLVARATIKIWWTLTMALIATAGIAAAISAYGCLSSMLAGHWYAAGGLLAAAAGSGLAAVLLCRYRMDLVGD